MALQVWLPLLGNLNNQGVQGNVVTSSNYSSASGGKIGNCIKTTSSGSIPLGYSSKQCNTGSLSFCGWFKLNKTEIWNTISGLSYTSTNSLVACNIIGNNSYGGVGLWIASNNIYNDGTLNSFGISSYLRTSTNGARAAGSWSIPWDTWFHACLVFNKSTKVLSLYINGLLSHYSTMLDFTDMKDESIAINYAGIAGGNGFGRSIPMLVNDIRVYDHALSTKEVKELAKCLVLHYKLDDISSYTNTIDITANYSIYNNNGLTSTLTATGEYYLGSPVRRLSQTPTSSYPCTSGLWSRGVYNWRQTFSANTKYCFWIYYRPVSNSDVRVGGTASNISGWTEIPPEEVGNGWYRVGQYRNGTVTENKTDNIFVSWYCPSAVAGTPVVIDFACPTLIVGTTEIQPEINYQALTTTVCDSSGFGYNGYIQSGRTIYTLSDSPRYSASTVFPLTSSQTGNYITMDNASFFSALSNCTITWWGKYKVAKSLLLTGQSTNHYLAAGNASFYNGTCTLTKWYKDGIASGTPSYVANEWHFYAFTGTLNSWTKLMLNNYGGGDAWSINGQISDFRIYNSTLSDTDILELYRTSASIDKNGNYYARELVE